MNFRKIFIWVLACGFPVMWSSCSGHHHEREHEHAHAHEHNGHSHEAIEEGEDHDGDEIVLEPDAARRFGVETTVVAPASFSETVKVTGYIELNPANLSNAVARSAGILTFAKGIVPGMTVRAGQTLASVSGAGVAGGDLNAVTAAELDAARRELDRLQPLYDSGVVSLKELNAAKAAYNRAKNASTGSGGGSAVVAPRGGVITSIDVAQGAFVDAGTVVAVISSGEEMILRADLPQKYASRASSFTGANFRTVSADSVYSVSDFGGRRVSSSSAPTKTMPGYLPIYFSLSGAGQLTADTFAEIYLIGGQRDNVISVPKDAITEEQGQRFVFVQIDEHGYEKRNVSIGATDGVNVEILSGLNPGDNVVTKGAIFVKLAQSSGAVPEGHSHNH